jgi:hypothetical protein
MTKTYLAMACGAVVAADQYHLVLAVLAKCVSAGHEAQSFRWIKH